jgi:hypothetical protein
MLNTVTEEPVTRTVVDPSQATPTQEFNEVTPHNAGAAGDVNPPAHHKIWTRVKTFNAGKDASLPLRRKRESETMAMRNECKSDPESDEAEGAKGSTSSTTVVEKGEHFTCETTITVNSKADTSKTVTIQRKIQLDPDSQEEESVQTETQESENYHQDSDFSEDDDYLQQRKAGSHQVSSWNDQQSSVPSSLGVEPLESSDRDVDSEMVESMEDRVHHYLSTSQARYGQNEYRDHQKNSQIVSMMDGTYMYPLGMHL